MDGRPDDGKDARSILLSHVKKQSCKNSAFAHCKSKMAKIKPICVKKIMDHVQWHAVHKNIELKITNDILSFRGQTE